MLAKTEKASDAKEHNNNGNVTKVYVRHKRAENAHAIYHNVSHWNDAALGQRVACQNEYLRSTVHFALCSLRKLPLILCVPLPTVPAALRCHSNPTHTYAHTHRGRQASSPAATDMKTPRLSVVDQNKS